MAALRAPAPTEQESVGQLVGRLGGDVGRIVRAEIALVQLRFTAAFAAVRQAGGGLAVGVVLGLAGLGAVVAGLVLLLALWLPAWAAALVVGGALLLVALLLALTGVRVLTTGVHEALAPTDDLTRLEDARS